MPNDASSPWGCFYGGKPPATGGGGTDIGFYAYRSLNQTISSGVETVIGFNVKQDENPSGVFNLTTDTFTAPQTGRYVFSSGIEMTIAARGSCYLRFYLNGVYNGSSSDEGSIPTTLTPNYSLVTWMVSGETAQMRAFQNSGFTGTLVGCCNQLWFSGAAIFIP